MGRKHLVFFDGSCGLCDQSVQFVYQKDRQGRFYFAPLDGETAKERLASLPAEQKRGDSVILIEDFEGEAKIYVRGKAAFRILWLLGGRWKALGWLFFLPAWLYDWGYRFIAHHRHRFFSMAGAVKPDPESQERFLP